jgi:hypothetical protein
VKFRQFRLPTLTPRELALLKDLCDFAAKLLGKGEIFGVQRPSKVPIDPCDLNAEGVLREQTHQSLGARERHAIGGLCGKRRGTERERSSEHPNYRFHGFTFLVDRESRPHILMRPTQDD